MQTQPELGLLAQGLHCVLVEWGAGGLSHTLLEQEGQQSDYN